MDTETIITVLVVVGAFIWNLIVKMRENAGGGGASPWPARDEEEFRPEDLLEEVRELQPRRAPTVARMPPAPKAAAPSVAPKRDSQAGLPLKDGASPVVSGLTSLVVSPQVKKMRRAVVWAEILQKPLALRKHDGV